jgi:hypothetical protein
MSIQDERAEPFVRTLTSNARGERGEAAARCWEEVQAAMAALEAADATQSKALYRTAAGVVMARAGAFHQAVSALIHLLEE